MFFTQNLVLMNNKNKYHILFISIFLINYAFPLLVFNKVTLFYHDNLDSMVVYNYILGNFFRGDSEIINNFLAGEIKIEYLRHLLKPFTLLYGIFNTELAYWINDFLVKITCYFSFFILSKKINSNIFLCCLISCLFACTNTFTTMGFGVAIFPYIIYLILYKKILKFKHYFILIFFGLNTDMVFDVFFIPFIVLVIFIINHRIIKEEFSKLIKILGIFFFSMLISSSNLIYAYLFSEQFHRVEFIRNSFSLIDNIKDTVLSIFRIPQDFTWIFFKNIPFSIFLVPLIFFSFFSKNITARKFLSLIFIVHLTIFFFNLESINSFRNNYEGLIKTFNITGITTYLPILYAFLFLYLIKKNEWFYKFVVYPSIISIFIFQINSSLVPIGKKYVLKEKDSYKNIYTFDGYYKHEEYSEIKKVVKDKRVLSVGLDPMVAIMNNIKTIDGYHALYPLSYKIKFRKIIKDELENNRELKRYYDNWGSRVYAFYTDEDNIQIDFKMAKKVGADFVISKFIIDSKDLTFVCQKCNTNLYLYKIE